MPDTGSAVFSSGTDDNDGAVDAVLTVLVIVPAATGTATGDIGNAAIKAAAAAESFLDANVSKRSVDKDDVVNA